MTAADTLASWRQIEQDAPKNWFDEQGREWLRDAFDPMGEDGDTIPEGETDRIINLVIASRTALPALLSFAEAVLARHHRRPFDHFRDAVFFGQHSYPDQCDVCRRPYPCHIAALAEQHLGGAS